jgi:hypothetical protein
MYAEKTFDVMNQKGVKVGEIIAYSHPNEYAGAELRLVNAKDINWETRETRAEKRPLERIANVLVTRCCSGLLDIECDVMQTGYDSVRNLRRMLLAVTLTDPDILKDMTDVTVLGSVDIVPAKVHHSCPGLDGEEYPKVIQGSKVWSRVRRAEDTMKFTYEAVADVVCAGMFEEEDIPKQKRLRIIV